MIVAQLTTPALVALVLALVTALVDWWAVATARSRVEYVAKPGVMVFLIAAAALLEPLDPSIRIAFIVALALGLVGDVFLMFDRFIPGAGAFLLGHIGYIVGLALAARWAPGLFLGVLFVALLMIPGQRIVRSAWQKSPVLGGIVAGYMVALAGVAILGLGSYSWYAAVGVVFFSVSDALLAWSRFVAPAAGGRVTVHITYHVGQALLVLALLTLGS
ncbi:MAG: lysoplasmalogenase [Actinomycetia bacterium]|nr:lysoplasmalogenase [Actinomycetes bacterium]